MRKLLLLLLVVGIGAIALYRQRLFLRDPLGKMFVNDVPVEDARVFINYTNDVLVMVGDGSTTPSLMVQGWDRVPGHPEALSCVRAMACLSGADRAAKMALGGSGYDPKTSMTDRVVSFVDERGRPVRVVIR